LREISEIKQERSAELPQKKPVVYIRSSIEQILTGLSEKSEDDQEEWDRVKQQLNNLKLRRIKSKQKRCDDSLLIEQNDSFDILTSETNLSAAPRVK
jgi:hypothetical protein